MSDPWYIYYKTGAVVLRTLYSIFIGHVIPHPDEVIEIPSRDSSSNGRTIKTHIYRPSKRQAEPQPSPVLVNFHGSGFMVPAHGSDDEFCRFIANNTPYTVLDVQYRLSPEHPFPAAFHDVEDAISFVRAHPETYDLTRLAISGFSAGANPCMAVSSSSTLFERDMFAAVVAIYGPTDLHEDTALKIAPDQSGPHIPSAVARFFHQSYIPAGADGRDPRISPRYASIERFPDTLAVITAAQCGFALEAEELAARVAALEGRRVIVRRMDECPHAWDKAGCRPGTVLEDRKWEAYGVVRDVLGSVI